MPNSVRTPTSHLDVFRATDYIYARQLNPGSRWAARASRHEPGKSVKSRCGRATVTGKLASMATLRAWRHCHSLVVGRPKHERHSREPGDLPHGPRSVLRAKRREQHWFARPSHSYGKERAFVWWTHLRRRVVHDGRIVPPPRVAMNDCYEHPASPRAVAPSAVGMRQEESQPCARVSQCWRRSRP
jgi:hypothetical protein